jgi:ornithine carbamoyltransferase
MRSSGFRGKHLLTWESWDNESIATVVQVADELKRHWSQSKSDQVLSGRIIHLLEYQPALGMGNLTMISAAQLGGYVSPVSSATLQGDFSMDSEDIALSLSRIGDAIVCCHDAWGVGHETIKTISGHASIPVITARSDHYAPIQAMADIMTLHEIYGRKLTGLKLALLWIYSKNPFHSLGIPHSLLQLATRMGMHVAIANPPEFPLLRSVVHQAKNYCQLSGGQVKRCDSMESALEGAQIIIPIHWGGFAHIEHFSGAEEQINRLREANDRYSDWRLNQDRLCLADFDSHVLHPIPYERDSGVDSEVLDGPVSAIRDQAENRLHIMKAILTLLLTGRP